MRPIHSVCVTPEQEQATKALAGLLGVDLDAFGQSIDDAAWVKTTLSPAEQRRISRIAYELDINVSSLMRAVLRGFLLEHQRQQNAA